MSTDASVFDRQKAAAFGLVPVSYTHLDVYKRQAHGRGIAGGGRGLWSLPAAGRGSAGHLQSVAHLPVPVGRDASDVYKRQVYLSSPAVAAASAVLGHIGLPEDLEAVADAAE